ncbi:MAG: hypothetical protein ACUVT5_01130 [Candidatus Bathyarchaeales archaeon]
MKLQKTSLFMVLVTMCFVFYSISEAYAATAIFINTPTPSETLTKTSADYGIPMTPSPPQHAYGDPIQDPRPRATRAPIV